MAEVDEWWTEMQATRARDDTIGDNPKKPVKKSGKKPHNGSA